MSLINLTPSEWLRSQAIRMRRTKYDAAWMLADELFLIFSRIPDETTGPVSITFQDSSLAPIQWPPIESINIPPLDFDAPEIPVPTPYEESQQQESGNTTVKTVEEITSRLACLGKVVSGSGSTYAVLLYPNGPGGIPISEPEANVPQIDSDAQVPENSYHPMFRIATLRITTRKEYDMNGVETSKQTQIEQLDKFTWFQPPIWLTATV